jgi:hypothetical protein
MKSVVIPSLLAVVLAVTGWAVWSMGKSAQRLADAHKQLAMLQYGDASSESDAAVAEPPLVQRVAGLGRDEPVDARHVKTTADYWQSAYGSLELKRDATGSIAESDPHVLLLAANASYRASQAETDRNAALRKLDSVVKSYAEVLKSGPSNPDAVYNYEYAVRVRDAVQKARPKTPGAKPNLRAAAGAESDLPTGATLHGHPGGPPPRPTWRSSRSSSQSAAKSAKTIRRRQGRDENS